MRRRRKRIREAMLVVVCRVGCREFECNGLKWKMGNTCHVIRFETGTILMHMMMAMCAGSVRRCCGHLAAGEDVHGIL